MNNTKNHIATRYKDITFCGLDYEKLNPFNVSLWWADAIKTIKSDPDYRGIKFCGNCMKIWKKKRIKQLNPQECKEA